MIWQNPWAFAGMLALAVPVMIHLLGRRSARLRRFPSLRFVTASQPLSTRRTTLSDIPLLVVRLTILVAAVAALARPLVLTADRERALGRALARAIIVDTSASMRRLNAAGERAVDAARVAARRLADEASASVIVETPAPARSLAGAAAWLGTKPGRREVIVVSDFQVGSLDGRDLDAVPPAIGIDLAPIDVAPLAGPIESPTRLGTGVVRTIAGVEGTTVEWEIRGPPPDGDGSEPVILAGADERSDAEAARTAALAIVPERPAPARPVAVVYRGFEQRAELLRAARPLNAPWQGDVVALLRADPELAAAASRAEIEGDSSFDRSIIAEPFTVVARSSGGRAVTVAARGAVAGRERLLLFHQGEAGALSSAALIAAVARAASTAPPAGEIEPASIPEATLASWARAAASVGASDVAGESDGRWFWIAALVMLGIETWMRRPRRDVRAREAVNERAA